MGDRRLYLHRDLATRAVLDAFGEYGVVWLCGCPDLPEGYLLRDVVCRNGHAVSGVARRWDRAMGG